MTLDYVHSAARWFGRHPDELGASERKALALAVQRRTLIEDPNLKLSTHLTLGERIADRVARLGGSWTFIAPIIMMSQNRQSATDRQMAVHDYEVNLKSEIEIMALREKMDAMRSEQLAALLLKQQEQIDMLTRLLARADRAGPCGPVV